MCIRTVKLVKWVNYMRPQEWLKALLAESTWSDECVPWPFAVSSNYGRVWDPALGKVVGAHVYVCRRTRGPRPKGYDAAHSCGNSLCVNPAHIVWKTRSENILDKKLHGTFNPPPPSTRRGSLVPVSTLTEPQVKKILVDERYQRVIAAEYGVHQSTISDIKTGRSWGWLTNLK